MKKAQILGKIGGATAEELELFNEAEIKLKQMGFEVFNPLNVKKSTPYLCLLECLKNLIDKRPIVVLLPTHTDSPGAEIELKLARQLNLIVYKNAVPALKHKNVKPTDKGMAIFDEVYRICEKYITTMPKDEFYSTARYSDLVFFRAAVSYAMYSVFQQSCSEIGYLLNKNRTSAYHYVVEVVPSILAVNYPAEKALQIKQIVLECENLKKELMEV